MNWTRKELKEKAKHTLRQNRMRIIIVCFLIAVVAAGYASSTLGWQIDSDDLNIQTPSTLSSQVRDIVTGIEGTVQQGEQVLGALEDRFTLRGATEGAIATLLNNSKASNSFLIGLLNTINGFVFRGEVLESTILAIATLLLFFFWTLVQNNLLVGECRFFLETKNYPESDARRLLFVYQVHKTFHVAWIMLLRSLFTFLWAFTIVGGPIKYYSYRMIPYILAENPTISRKEAFQLSAALMKGNKWKAFQLDMSFFFWQLLSFLTLGIVGFVYVNPYLGATRCELYYQLRETALAEEIPLSQYLCDSYLLHPPAKLSPPELYPMEDYLIPVPKKKEGLNLEYDRRYSPLALLYIFFSMAFVGWVWEVFLYLLKTGGFVNRGTLTGPWLPIYGVGSVLVLVLLRPLIKKPAAFFVGAFVVCGSLEYFTSWLLETLFHTAWWDYSKVFFNINGRICLEGLLFFATGASLVAYLAAPLIDDLVKRIPLRQRQLIAGVLVALFALDVVSGFFHPNQGEGITTQIADSPTLEAEK